jgi:predicted RNA binding protein YcfA (HicA-like mRNA interferase family)
MASLPIVSGSRAVHIFQRFGWTVVRQSSSHIIMTKEGEIASLSIPNHKESQEVPCEVSFGRPI